jgi:spermidine/putrescine transport system substrate-binding protein
MTICGPAEKLGNSLEFPLASAPLAGNSCPYLEGRATLPYILTTYFLTVEPIMKKALYLAASALALGVATSAHAADPDLIVFDWAGFEVQALVEPYVAMHGQMPTYAFYGDEEEAFTKVSTGFKADLAHPCSQMVRKYRDKDLIEPWDTSRIPEFANIAPRFLESGDIKDDGGVWYIPTDYA